MILVREGTNFYSFYGSMLSNASRNNSLTEYPTVEGTSFVDHYYREPESINFSMKVSEISKSFVHLRGTDAAGGTFEEDLSSTDVADLLGRWFKEMPSLEVTTLRYTFSNMRLQTYSWSDQDEKLFNPTLTFKETKVQTMRLGVVENPDQYYQAAYGDVISVGGAAAVESPANIGSALFAGGAGAAIGAAVGSLIPGLGTAAGAIIGGCIGFFGNLIGIG